MQLINYTVTDRHLATDAEVYTCQRDDGVAAGATVRWREIR